jgi:hypothetical protein
VGSFLCPTLLAANVVVVSDAALSVVVGAALFHRAFLSNLVF